jgi:glycosyltransferase involved in cell wall biosynthesis
VCVLVERPSDLGDRLDELGVQSERWRSIVRNPSPIRDVAARRELRRTVARIRPDVLHVHSAKAGVLGRGILVPPHGVTVYTCHHAPFGPGRRLSHRVLARPVEQLTLRYTHGIISVGARDMPMLRRLAPGVPVVLVRNAVPAPAAPPDLDGPPPEVAVWVARMAHPKDPVQAVKAWEHVVAARPDARLVMVGTGPLDRALRTAIADSPVRGSIDHRGRVPSVQAVLAEGSIYLLATQVEGGTTMATLEAMTEGLVPVMSDAGDAFLYTHAGCGVVVARNAPAALGAAVAELFSHPSRLQEMRHRALAFTRAWTVDDMVAATEDVYRTVLAGSAA